jgi:GNAT superfamily N-acetyltransferase
VARRGRISPAFTIREYRDSDEPQVIELVRELQTHESPFNKWGKPPEDIGSWYIAETKNWCAKREGIMLVAEHANVLLGYASLLNKCEEEGTGGDFAYLYAYIADLVVTKSARGQGIGRALLRACEKIARDKGGRVLRIGVLAQNENAKQVYLNFGFVPHHMTLDKMLT